VAPAGATLYFYVHSSIINLTNSPAGGFFNKIYMERFSNYLKATAAEMKQVKWPTKRTAAFYSLLVIVISVITALYAGAFDFLFGEFINYVVTNF